MNKRVTELSVGDVLASGAKVIERPFDSVRCPKGKINLGIQYSNGERRIVQWGKSTTVFVVGKVGVNQNPEWQTNLQAALIDCPSDIIQTLQFQTPEVGEGENITLLREMFKIALDSKKTYH